MLPAPAAAPPRLRAAALRCQTFKRLKRSRRKAVGWRQFTEKEGASAALRRLTMNEMRQLAVLRRKGLIPFAFRNEKTHEIITHILA